MSFHVESEQRRLIHDLLEGYIVSMEDSKRTILDIPELRSMAQDGMAQIDAQIELARDTLAVLDA